MECDNALLVKTILVGGATSSRMTKLQLIHLLLSRNWIVRFCQISRSQNKVADQMVKCALNSGVGFISFEESPTSVRDLL